MQPNPETQAVITALEVSLKLRQWVASAPTGEALRRYIEFRLADDCILAEFSTGVNGALVDMVNDLLAIVFDKVDWDAALKVAKQQAGQLEL